VQGNVTIIIILNDKVKIYWEVGFWVKNLEGKYCSYFFPYKDFEDLNILKASDIGINQRIEDDSVNLQSMFSKYFRKE
jgi:hypothetical protein